MSGNHEPHRGLATALRRCCPRVSRLRLRRGCFDFRYGDRGDVELCHEVVGAQQRDVSGTLSMKTAIPPVIPAGTTSAKSPSLFVVLDAMRSMPRIRATPTPITFPIPQGTVVWETLASVGGCSTVSTVVLVDLTPKVARPTPPKSNARPEPNYAQSNCVLLRTGTTVGAARFDVGKRVGA